MSSIKFFCLWKVFENTAQLYKDSTAFQKEPCVGSICKESGSKKAGSGEWRQWRWWGISAWVLVTEHKKQKVGSGNWERTQLDEQMLLVLAGVTENPQDVATNLRVTWFWGCLPSHKAGCRWPKSRDRGGGWGIGVIPYLNEGWGGKGLCLKWLELGWEFT